MTTIIFSLISAAFPSIMKLVGSYIDNKIAKGEMDKKAKVSFLAFVQDTGKISMADIKKDSDSQLDEANKLQ